MAANANMHVVCALVHLMKKLTYWGDAEQFIWLLNILMFEENLLGYFEYSASSVEHNTMIWAECALLLGAYSYCTNETNFNSLQLTTFWRE